jgi:hypothetical protein
MGQGPYAMDHDHDLVEIGRQTDQEVQSKIMHCATDGCGYSELEPVEQGA